MEPLAVGINDAAKASSLSRATLYRLIDRGELETSKVGGRTLVLMASLKRVIGTGAETKVAA